MEENIRHWNKILSKAGGIRSINDTNEDYK